MVSSTISSISGHAKPSDILPDQTPSQTVFLRSRPVSISLAKGIHPHTGYRAPQLDDYIINVLCPCVCPTSIRCRSSLCLNFKNAALASDTAISPSHTEEMLPLSLTRYRPLRDMTTAGPPQCPVWCRLVTVPTDPFTTFTRPTGPVLSELVKCQPGNSQNGYNGNIK